MKLWCSTGRKLANNLLFACILHSPSKEAKTVAFEAIEALTEGRSYNTLTVKSLRSGLPGLGCKRERLRIILSAYRKPLPKSFSLQDTPVFQRFQCILCWLKLC